ncbi:hypothetical protein K431DRAFT_135684 [Polychaeton citri CBS 116435]|uniref:Uncharacterized protein n=1 Tax=Polychaeton citri CBS 116435 TaxID=1314669 RepID=A0A9P4UJY6_9PEZI|nr:hypothetical protein K431DRAFT_135684 [Polychaeton citri CBS 116435]
MGWGAHMADVQEEVQRDEASGMCTSGPGSSREGFEDLLRSLLPFHPVSFSILFLIPKRVDTWRREVESQWQRTAPPHASRHSATLTFVTTPWRVCNFCLHSDRRLMAKSMHSIDHNIKFQNVNRLHISQSSSVFHAFYSVYHADNYGVCVYAADVIAAERCLVPPSTSPPNPGRDLCSHTT